MGWMLPGISVCLVTPAGVWGVGLQVGLQVGLEVGREVGREVAMQVGREVALPEEPSSRPAPHPPETDRTAQVQAPDHPDHARHHFNPDHHQTHRVPLHPAPRLQAMAATTTAPS